MPAPTLPHRPAADPVGDLATDLAARVRGPVIAPHHPEYDALRAVWNGMIDRRPAAIVQVADARDVAGVLAVARARGLPVAVRGGGHHVAGLATDEGALVVDLRGLRAVQVDPAARLARVGGGATWADVDAATAPHGLVTPGGVVSETGVAGLTLGGGLGWLRRRFGLACDQLVGAELVLADGRVLEVDDARHPDLMWALRGAGGNVGVATRLDFRLHPFPETVDLAFVVYPLEEAPSVVAGVLELARDLVDGIAPLLVFGRAPAGGPFPPELVGRAYVAVLAVNGEAEPERGAPAMARLRALARPLADLSGALPYVDVQRLLDADYPAGGRYYWSSTSLTGFDADAVARVAEHLARMPEGHSTIDLWVLGGAMARVPVAATAYADRGAPLLLNVEANWHHATDDARYIGWARDALAAFAPWSAGRGYLNFPGLLEDGAARVRRAFGPNHERLARVKAEVDPTNVFRRNPNVAPAAAGTGQ